LLHHRLIKEYLLSLEHVWGRRVVLILWVLDKSAERNFFFLLAEWQIVDLVCESDVIAIDFLKLVN
jgi:hypothetical protein